jgi:hypothetical protein
MSTYITSSIDCKGICWNDVFQVKEYFRIEGYSPGDFSTSSASKGKVTESFGVKSKKGEYAEISVIHRDAPTLFEENIKFNCRMAVFAPSYEVAEYIGNITGFLEGKVDSMEIR